MKKVVISLVSLYLASTVAFAGNCNPKTDVCIKFAPNVSPYKLAYEHTTPDKGLVSIQDTVFTLFTEVVGGTMYMGFPGYFKPTRFYKPYEKIPAEMIDSNCTVETPKVGNYYIFFDATGGSLGKEYTCRVMYSE